MEVLKDWLLDVLMLLKPSKIKCLMNYIAQGQILIIKKENQSAG